jgi:hypothetical protein
MQRQSDHIVRVLAYVCEYIYFPSRINIMEKTRHQTYGIVYSHRK